ncbi:p53-like transcription factor, partial [Basidiobolus meristosporus CBS 931.73]
MCATNEAGPLFTQTKQQYGLYSPDKLNSYTARVDCKFDRGFFLADSDWTCYRRNYFQVSGAFTLIGLNHPLTNPECPCLIEVDAAHHGIINFHLGIFAQVSNNDKRITLIQHTPKRDKGPQIVPTAKPVQPGGNVHLSSIGSSQTIVTFERIQFKTATANNGKRRSAQQYYVVVMELLAECDNGETYQVATSNSAPLVVRGRSPGHYANGNDRLNRYNTSTPPDERYYQCQQLPSDAASPYSTLPPFTPYPCQSPAQLMMTPPTPNSVDSFQNHSPYTLHDLNRNGTPSSEAFANG